MKNLESLNKISMLLEQFFNTQSEKNKQDVDKLFTVLIGRILQHFEILNIDKEKMLDQLFDQNLEFNKKRFVAVILLKLISINETILEEREISLKIIKLFDEVLDDIYKSLTLNKNDQTYVKISKLKSFIPNVEQEFNSHVSSLIDLDNFPDFRTSFSRKINFKHFRVVITSLVPEEAIQHLLKNIFPKISAYIESDTKLLEIYNETLDLIDDYLREFNWCTTSYFNLYFLNVLLKLKRLIEEDFISSPQCQSTRLYLRAVEKKYPIEVANTKIKLLFEVVNEGPGNANDVNISVGDSDLEIKDSYVSLGVLTPGKFRISFEAFVDGPRNSTSCYYFLEWSDFQGVKKSTEGTLEFLSQEKNIDWEKLEIEDPFSLEAIRDDLELYGRKEVLKLMYSQLKNKNMGSFFIYGQKRVGKSSVVLSLISYITRNTTDNYVFVYLERGAFQGFDEMQTLNNLCNSTAKSLQLEKEEIRIVNVPDFSNVESPHVLFEQYLKEVAKKFLNIKFVFIFDEFDELPQKLYKKGDMGDAFFGSLRTISGIPNISLIMVGGENMKHILDYQGQSLNKFNVQRIDYFEKDTEWEDYKNMIVQSFGSSFHITEDVVENIYFQSAGNPFFTKLICRVLFSEMVKKRDLYVTIDDLTLVLSILQNRELAQNKFQHFWEDGVLENKNTFEEKTIRRKKVLLGLTELFRIDNQVEIESLFQLCEENYEIEKEIVRTEIEEFKQRKIITSNKDNKLDLRIKLFKTWLMNKGFEDLIITFKNTDEYLRRKKKEEELRIKAEEIVNIKKKISNYRGETISEDKIRTWLNQFGGPIEQRIIFPILENIKFYSHALIREKLREAFGIVMRKQIKKIEQGKRKYDNILVSYVDGLGKSGATYARLFADENSIYSDNVAVKNEILNILEVNKKINLLIFIDDFIGTGNSMIDHIELVKDKIHIVENEHSVLVFVIGIVGFTSGKIALQKYLDKNNLKIQLHICEELGDEHRSFSSSSRIYKDKIQREKALNLCHKFGGKIVKENPLGYGDLQAAIVFESSCPNNTLPVLWSNKNEWVPLFKRI